MAKKDKIEAKYPDKSSGNLFPLGAIRNTKQPSVEKTVKMAVGKVKVHEMTSPPQASGKKPKTSSHGYN